MPPLNALSARVTLSSGSFQGDWKANVARLSDTVNLNQATVGVILEIPLIDEMTSSGTLLPSLVNGMFVKATIEGLPRPHWVIPEQALRGDKVYLLERGGLTIVPVTVVFRKGESVAIDGPLKNGQNLVLNDILPAVPGMLLRAVTKDGHDVAKVDEAEEDAS